MERDLEQIAKDIVQCQRCELRQGATNPVPGFGDIGAKYYLLGEAPGREEDEDGIPFVGASGRKLDQLLELAGIDINDCFIANVLRCRPPGNRDPKKKEILACKEYIYREIKAIQPECIITVGRFALQLFSDNGITQMHGTQFKANIDGQEFPVVAQYHPAASFKNPRLWATILDDWENFPESVPHDYKIVKSTKSYPKLVSVDTEGENLAEWSLAYRNAKGELCVEPHVGPMPAKVVPSQLAMHNAKWDIRIFQKAKMHKIIDTPIHDTMIMGYCVHPSTKVLTRDLHWVEIGCVSVGDELVGVDEELPQARVKKGRRKMLPTKVTYVERRVTDCYEVIFDNGKRVVASTDHPWMAQQLGNRAGWIRTDKLRPKWRLLGAIPTWEEDTSYEAGYLAGVFDGEGSWLRHSLNMTQKPGEVLDKTRRFLSNLGFQYGEYIRRSDGCHRLYLHRTVEAMKFVGSVRPTRLLSKEQWIGLSPTHIESDVKVLGLFACGKQEVVTIETTTHTYNAEGFWVHNCLGLGKQAPKDDTKSRSGADMVGGLGLKYLARRHLGMQMKTWREVRDTPDVIPEYNADDSIATYLLAEKWLPIMPKHYFDIDMPLLRVLMAMEDKGIMINPDYVEQYAKELDNKLAEYDLPLNPYATQEIQSYIYGTLEIEPFKFTDTGLPSIEKEVLEAIPDPLVRQIIEFKDLAKEKGTYVDNYIKAADINNRIHPEIKQTSTSTSRLSIARPNLQNVFKRDERVKLRAMFCAPEGYKIVRMDYNQLDYRTLAAISQDQTIIAALNANKKIHQVTADEMGISYDDAKTVNFGTMFGQEAWALSLSLHITIGEAKEFLANYFKRFPNLKKYRDEMKEIALNEKHVTIPFTGRKRRIDAMLSGNWKIRNEGIKEAINLPVQGLEAEVVKIGMIDLFYKHNIVPVLQVHDELLFEVPDKEAVDFAYWLKEYIPTVVEFGGMKFPVEMGVGQNWYEAMKNEVK